MASRRRYLASRCISVAAGLSLLSLAACSDTPTTVSPFNSEAAPIINGTTTSSWPAVGSLVMSGGSPWFSYCSATLIASQWVLTAAHCVDPNDSDLPHEYQANFFVGSNVSATGSAYIVDAIHAHEDYDSTYVQNDIAVVHLAQAVPTSVATPITYNTSNVSSGNAITWIGYGVNVADGQGGGSGGGIKRYAYGTISSANSFTYNYNHNASGQLTCFGDSGGPDLVGSTGSERVSGVHSTVSDDYCTTSGTSTRVDAYSTWIANKLAGGGPIACDIAGGDCGSQACTVIDVDVFRCLPSDGKAIGATCNADPNSWTNMPCVDGATCLDYIDGAKCYEYCGTASDCSGGKKCAFVFTDLTNVGICLASVCDIVGGDCGTGACYPLAAGVNRCFTSAGGVLGETCDPTTPESDPLPCGDGLICLQTGALATAGTCSQFCSLPTDCPGGTCDIPVFTGVTDIGVCTGASTCACNTAAGCQTSCACDPDCCACDTGPGCQPACSCDGDVGCCTCNTGAGCQAGCTCDPDCQSADCTCDTNYYCDDTCACDAECPCTCDTTYGCDKDSSGGSDCSCDIDCGDKGCGCSFDQGASGLLVAPVALFLLFINRRRRATRTEST